MSEISDIGMRNKYEDEIVVLSLGTIVSDMEIAKRLAAIEDNALYEERTFKTYLKHLAKRVWEAHQIKASGSNYERLLSHFRLFVEKLGFAEKDVLMIGMGNLDLLRTMIDWRFYQREIGDGSNGKLDEEKARELVAEMIESAREQGGALPMSVVKAEQERILGRTPVSVKLVLRRLDEDRWKVTAIELWEGGVVHRAMESLSTEKAHWLAKRMRASTEEVEF
jgi:hypothetical protein